ncbi:MAG: YbaK/EbsC family protein [Betaproteobacteria bacterium]|nr:YbaK/EbsC family protein [Betaproteobacteria bacterium]MBI2959019.1 YbaK/EbsC family protein [Betaproteobacteria bacterium]
MGIAMKLSDYLKASAVQYDVVPHPHSGSSMQTARASNVPAQCLAKAVVLEDDTHAIMAVLPASRRLRLGELEASNGRALRLASERELKSLFNDCEPGAVPPLGAAYGMETIWDDSLSDQPEMYFEAGDHETLVHMKTKDFIGLMKDARHMAFSSQMDEERGPLF